MEASAKFVFEILLFLIVLILVLYGIVDKGIVSGLGSIFDIGGDWLGKLFS
ncbi:MAG: hypothetical protein ACP5E4_01165 [Candidatus Aenigmatarchaeota archaeon]